MLQRMTQKTVTSVTLMFFLVNQNHDAVSIQFRSTKVFFKVLLYQNVDEISFLCESKYIDFDKITGKK
jgi:hypothetical protein